MADGIVYPNILDNYMKAAQASNAMYEAQMAPVRMQNEFITQRINQIKARDLENEFATKMGRQERGKQFFKPAQPAQTAVPMQTGAAPSYTGNAFAQNMYGQSVETAPAVPEKRDYAGYIASSYGAGDVAGAQEMEGVQRTQKADKMAVYKPLYDAAVNSGNDAQFQNIVENMKREGLLPQDFQANVVSNRKVKSMVDVQPGSVNPNTGQPWTDPVSGQPLPTGKYTMTSEGPNVIEVEPYQKGADTLPYKMGERQKFTGKDGTEYEGTFKGLDEKGEPKFENAVKVSKEKPIDPFAYDKSSRLRKEFLEQTKTFREVRDSYARISASAKDPSAAGDLALIFNYMKMLDPGSVVREGEFANAQNAAGVPDRIVAKYNKVISGERLAPDTRADFVNRAKELFGRQNSQTKKTRSEYERLAKSYGLEPSMVIVDIEDPMDVPAAAAPASGGKTAPAAAQSEFNVGPYKVRVKQ